MHRWYTNIVQGSTNGTIGTNGNENGTIGTNGNDNGTIESPNGTIGTIGKPPMVPLVKLQMVPLGEPRTEPRAIKDATIIHANA